jgi:hypothetical protein
MAKWYDFLKEKDKESIFQALQEDKASSLAFVGREDALKNADNAFDAFTDMIAPKNSDDTPNKEFITWACKQYLSTIRNGAPARAEDLFKVKRDLELFAVEKKAQRLKGVAADLAKYDLTTLREWSVKRQDERKLARILSGEDVDVSLDADRLTLEDLDDEDEIELAEAYEGYVEDKEALGFMDMIEDDHSAPISSADVFVAHKPKTHDI